MLKQKILFALLLVSSASIAQTKFAIFGGAQATSADYKIRDISQSTEYKKDGMMAGFALRVPFDGNLYFHPALYYSRKGYKVTYNQKAFPPDTAALNNNTTIHTVEFSPMLYLAFSKKPGHVFLRFGPAMDYNVKGQETFELTKTTGVEVVTRDMTFSPRSDYGLVTASVNVHLGIQTGFGLQLFAHYAHGLGSLNNEDYGPEIRHRIAGVSIGWTFANRKSDINSFLKEIGK